MPSPNKTQLFIVGERVRYKSIYTEGHAKWSKIPGTIIEIFIPYGIQEVQCKVKFDNVSYPYFVGQSAIERVFSIADTDNDVNMMVEGINNLNFEKSAPRALSAV